MHFICIVCILSCAANGVINDDDQAAAAARDSEPAGLSIDAVHLFVCSFVCLFVAKMRTQNAIFSKTKQFRDMVSIDDP